MITELELELDQISEKMILLSCDKGKSCHNVDFSKRNGSECLRKIYCTIKKVNNPMISSSSYSLLKRLLEFPLLPCLNLCLDEILFETCSYVSFISIQTSKPMVKK